MNLKEAKYNPTSLAGILDKQYVKSEIIPKVQLQLSKGDVKGAFDAIKGNHSHVTMLAQVLDGANPKWLAYLDKIPAGLLRSSQVFRDELIIPSNVKEVGNFAFYDTDYKKLTLEEGISYIGKGAFLFENPIPELKLPKSLFDFKYAIENCGGNFQDGIPSIRSGAFGDVDKIIVPLDLDEFKEFLNKEISSRNSEWDMKEVAATFYLLLKDCFLAPNFEFYLKDDTLINEKTVMEMEWGS